MDEGAVQTRDTEPTKYTYQPSLDGLRALAVLAIIAFHFDYRWAQGAYLSVDLFFVLSGFLITTLLVIEWRRRETIALRTFWGRRARRLLPALLLVLVFVAVLTRVVIDPWNRVGVRADGVASLFYVANWHFIAAKEGYFELFAAASPLRHMWTLAIEEQFYLVWPPIVLATLRLARGSLRALALVCGAGIAASVVVMALTYLRGDALRAYYGTDARAHTILFGALLAIVLATWRPGAAAARRLRIAGSAAFVTMLLAWSLATGTSPRYYLGGSALYALLVCVVIAGSLQPGPLRSILSRRPLAWIGRLSYRLYLFHWPVIVWLVPTRVHLYGLQLNALRLAITFAAATLSYYLVEAPIRERRAPAPPWHRATAAATTAVATRSGRPRRRSLAPRAAIPAIALTLSIVLASSTGATAAPSYLSGTRTPQFASAIPSAIPSALPSAVPGSRPPHGTTAVTFALPKINFIWSYGDPLFCGSPRASETAAAVKEATKLGPPRLPRAAAGLRILILGDSTACSLYPGLKAVGDEVGAVVAQAAVFGCGMASGQITTTRGEQITPHTERCPAMVEAAQVPAIAQMRPDVVIWMSLWEKSDVIADGRTLVSGTPAGDDEMLIRMEAELARVTRYGAKVLMITDAPPAPNDAQGTNASDDAVDDASYARLQSIDRRFAARHPGSVTLVDLTPRLCPQGPQCPELVDGMRMRPDGRHFTPAAATVQATWLMPRIVAAA
jgi:peptidoglycan/LPS O-acetylase OafA/YrhL